LIEFFWISNCAQDNAEQYKFILIAPDSQSADLGGWRIPLANQAPTPDVLHIQVGARPDWSETGVVISRLSVVS